MRSSDFMRALPERVREHCPPQWQHFKVRSRAWLTQLYFHDSRIHYEAWNLGRRLSPHPNGSLELGLHFESRNRSLNAQLLRGFDRHMVEVKATLGSQWEAEQWDKGWAKVYTTIPRDTFNAHYLEHVARQLAEAIGTLQPILERIHRRLAAVDGESNR